VKYTIIGAGVAGLTAGLLLAEKGKSVEIFEQDSQVGGIAKTVNYPNYRFDLGGHRFLTKYPEVQGFWSQILGREFLSVGRQSRIYYGGRFLNYPLRPVDALSLGPLSALQAVFSHLWAKARPIKPEKNLEDVYVNSFGRFLYNRFFNSYSQRLWGIAPKKMEPDWGRARVGKLSLTGAIKDAFFPKVAEVKSLAKKFYYPKLGPSQMWEEMANRIKKNGSRIILGSPITKIYHQKNKIIALDTGGKKITIDNLIASVALRDFVLALEPRAPQKVIAAARRLRYRDYILVALAINKKSVFPDQWIYIQDAGFKCLRIQNINNWSRAMVKDKQQTILGLEYITGRAEPLWQKTDSDLAKLGRQEVVKLGFCTPPQIMETKVVRGYNFYPVYDLGYRKHLEVIKEYLSRFKNLILIGRNGQHKYNNMDHSVLSAMLAVKKLAGEQADPWSVNPEEEYLEKK
jgi:protoporphyrinogen oxidase